MNKYDYKKIAPFKWFILENFPLIDEDFDALTNWQLFCKLGKEINKIIKSQNDVGEQMENLTDAFIALQDYVTNYFDNLDVQDEIDNKLDEMVEDGTLEDLIGEYITDNIQRVYNTVSEMAAATLSVGMFVKTLGYYQANDGGGALYKIVESSSGYYESIGEDLKAELVIENDTINALQIGIKRNDDTYNAHDKIITICQNYNYKLFFPEGNYYMTETYLAKNYHVDIEGETTCFINKTWFRPYGANNGYIIKCGGKANYTVDSTSNYTLNQLTNFKINGVTFSDWNNPLSHNKYSYSSCLAIDNCANGELNVKFYYCNTNGLLLRESWEIQSNYLSFRGMYGPFDTCGMLIATRSMPNSGSGTNALFFNLLDFEQINGRCITTEDGANCGNIAINTITIENSRNTGLSDLLSKRVATIATSELLTYRATYNFNPMLSFKGQAISISKIDVGAGLDCYYYKDGDDTQGKYTDVILETSANMTINNIIMSSLMTAILTKYFDDTLAITTINSINGTPVSGQVSMPGKTCRNIYIINEVLSAHDSTTFINIVDKTIIIDPDIVKTKGTGFYDRMELLQFFNPYLGWQNYGVTENLYCFHLRSTTAPDGFLNNIKILQGKKLRIHYKPDEAMIGDAAPLLLLNSDGTTAETINSGISNWVGGTWYTVEYTITSTSYYRLKLAIARNGFIDWVEIV